MAGPWYVTTTGNDTTGDGLSEATAYATLQKAHDSATAGDTVYLKGGVYADPVSGTKNLTVIGYGTSRPRLWGGADVTASEWTEDSQDVWMVADVQGFRKGSTDVGFISGARCGVIVETTDGQFLKGWQVDSVVAVDSDTSYGVKFFYDQVAEEFYIYSNGDPAVAYAGVYYCANRGTESTVSGQYGGVLWEGATLTMRGVDVWGWDGNGIQIYDGSYNLSDVDASFNSEDGAGGFRGVSPVSSRCRFRWNGARRPLSGAELWTDGDGESWHANGGVETTGLSSSFCEFVGNTKNAFQHIDNTTGTILGARIHRCNFGIFFNHGATGDISVISSRVTAESGDLGGVAVINLGTANIYGCTLYGNGTATAISAVVGNLTNLRGCAIKNWAVGHSGTVPTTESHNGWNVTSVGLTPAGTSFTTTFTLLGADLGIARTSACFGTGVAISGLNFDGAGKARPTTPSVGAMEPYRTGSTSGAGGVVTWLD